MFNPIKTFKACHQEDCCPQVFPGNHDQLGGVIRITDDNTEGLEREIYLKPEQVGPIVTTLLEALAEISPKDRMKAIEKIGEVLSPSEIGYFRTIGEPV